MDSRFDSSQLPKAVITVSIGRLIVAALLAVAYIFVAVFASSHRLVATWFMFGIPLLGFAAEVDEVRTPRVRLPRWIPRLLAAPFVPGEGRGVLFLLLSLAAGLGAMLLGRALSAPDEKLFGSTNPTQALGLFLFSSAYGMTTSLVAAFLPAQVRWRAVAAVFGVWLFGVLGSLFLSDRFPIALALNPMQMLAEVKRNGQWTDIARTVVTPAVIVDALLFGLVLPSIVRGLMRLLRSPSL